MHSKKIFASAITAASLSLIGSYSINAQAAVCDNSAGRMFNSCLNETREEYWASLARCANVEDLDERVECVEDTKAERMESREECEDQLDARDEVCMLLGERRYEDPLLDENIVFVDPDDVGPGGMYSANPFVSVVAGHTAVLRSEETVITEPDEEEGEPGGEEKTEVEIVVVHVTDEVREIQGVPCRVVLDVVLEPEYDDEEGKWEFEAVEVTDDWFAQDTGANVYYCGEIARNFEDDVLRDLDGSFEAGLDLAQGGLLISAAPMPGESHRQEYALGEAEDLVEYISLSATPLDEGFEDNADFPCGEAGSGECLQAMEFAPLEPGHSEYKYFLPGVGFVLALPIEDGEVSANGSERLVCTGDSLDVLFSTACGFGEDAEELAETLCELADEFCDDED